MLANDGIAAMVVMKEKLCIPVTKTSKLDLFAPLFLVSVLPEVVFFSTFLDAIQKPDTTANAIDFGFGSIDFWVKSIIVPPIITNVEVTFLTDKIC